MIPSHPSVPSGAPSAQPSATVEDAVSRLPLPLPQGYRQVATLIERGVQVPNPWTVTIGDEVDLEAISSDGVVLHPGTRILGADTVIGPGCELGAETPLTMINCRLGQGVRLAGGYCTDAVFLDGSSMGSGAHVRGGTLLEEHANAAHTVGLKQTILFPFVTLGSLINFCDVMMTGGTSRSDHSEVGSSYVHFNFTPDGDKTTASLFGDVPRGVLLDQPPIFLGGQGGAVGPVRTGFGDVVGAGSVLRDDVLDDGQLVVTAAGQGLRRPVTPHQYRKLERLLRNNLIYIANLVALRAWYRQVRAVFWSGDRLGEGLLTGALAMIDSGLAERRRRLQILIGKLETGPDTGQDRLTTGRAELVANAEDFLAPLREVPDAPPVLIERFADQAASGRSHIEAVLGLDDALRTAARSWLAEIVAASVQQSARAVPSLQLVD